MSEYLTRDTHLDFSEDGSAFKELYGLNSYPDMGSEPDKQEVTNMRDKNKRYINGLEDPGSLAFEFFYNNTQDGEAVDNDLPENIVMESFAELKKLADKKLHWRLVFPDGSGYEWQGKPNAYIKGNGTNSPMAFSLNVSLESSLDYKEDIEAAVETTTETT